jgi:hypothetical protein
MNKVVDFNDKRHNFLFELQGEPYSMAFEDNITIRADVQQFLNKLFQSLWTLNSSKHSMLEERCC